MKLLQKTNIPKNQVPEYPSEFVKELQSLGLLTCVLDEDDQEKWNFATWMKEWTKIIHVDDLEKARAKKQPKRLKQPLKLKKLRKQQKRKPEVAAEQE